MSDAVKDTKRSLVLIHGSGGSGQHWNCQVAYFTRKGYRVLAVDLPGHGSSPGPGRQDIALYADDVEALLRAEGIERPVIGGHSMGGAVVLTMALRNPRAYAGLVLVGTGARLRVLPAIFEAIRTSPEAAAEIMAKTAYSSKVSAEDLRRAVKQLGEVDPEVMYGDFTACDRFDVMKEIGRISTPTLVVVGREDNLTPPKYSEYLRANIPNSTLEVIEDAGHMVMLEQPDRFNAALERFLETLPEA